MYILYYYEYPTVRYLSKQVTTVNIVVLISAIYRFGKYISRQVVISSHAWCLTTNNELFNFWFLKLSSIPTA